MSRRPHHLAGHSNNAVPELGLAELGVIRAELELVAKNRVSLVLGAYAPAVSSLDDDGIDEPTTDTVALAKLSVWMRSFQVAVPQLKIRRKQIYELFSDPKLRAVFTRTGHALPPPRFLSYRFITACRHIRLLARTRPEKSRLVRRAKDRVTPVEHQMLCRVIHAVRSGHRAAPQANVASPTAIVPHRGMVATRDLGNRRATRTGRSAEDGRGDSDEGSLALYSSLSLIHISEPTRPY